MTEDDVPYRAPSGAMSLEEWCKKQLAKGLTPEGREVSGGEPVAPPIGYVEGPDLIDQIRAMVRREISRAAEAEGFESFEEADDFEVGDDYDPTSPYEDTFEPSTRDGPLNPDTPPAGSPPALGDAMAGDDWGGGSATGPGYAPGMGVSPGPPETGGEFTQRAGIPTNSLAALADYQGPQDRVPPSDGQGAPKVAGKRTVARPRPSR